VCKKNAVKDEVLWDRAGDVDADMTMSVCMLIRRELLERIERLDEELWTYYFNDWLCWQVRQRGLLCRYLKDARVIHCERFTDRTLYSSRSDSSYKATPLQVEARMQKDRFAFLRQMYPGQTVLLLKLIAIAEYAYQIIVGLPKCRGRRQAIVTYSEVIKAVWNG
jgi:GT2 family glycosyltransferase